MNQGDHSGADNACPAWMVGKTGPSIKFVKDALEYLKHTELDDDIRKLEERIGHIMYGSESLIQEQTVEDFLHPVR